MDFGGGKAILAPMVRVGSLPMRLLALEYGADLVYSPEIVDKGLIACERVVNEITGTIDFVNRNNRQLVFRTIADEKERLIFQLGSSDPNTVAEAVKLIRDDVSALDLNCGCPKDFSLKGGMGAALLRDPDRIISILRAMKEHGNGLPVTVKIRMLAREAGEEESSWFMRTASFCQRLVRETSISALALHCREAREKPSDPGHWEIFRVVKQALPPDFPLILNGDIFGLEDGARALRESGASSFMMARAAQYNVSVFCKDALKPTRQVSERYVILAMETDTPFNICKFTLLQMWPERSPHSATELTIGDLVLKAKSYERLSVIFGLESQFEALLSKRMVQYQESLSRNPQQLYSPIALFSEKQLSTMNLKINNNTLLLDNSELPYVPREVFFPIGIKESLEQK